MKIYADKQACTTLPHADKQACKMHLHAATGALLRLSFCSSMFANPNESP